MTKHFRPAPFVTAHAMIRYLERVHRIDIRALKIETGTSSEPDLLDEIDARIPGFVEVVNAHLRETCRRAFALGGSYYRTDEAIFMFKGGALVTVLDRDMKPPIDGSAALRIVAGLAEMGDVR